MNGTAGKVILNHVEATLLRNHSVLAFSVKNVVRQLGAIGYYGKVIA